MALIEPQRDARDKACPRATPNFNNRAAAAAAAAVAVAVEVAAEAERDCQQQQGTRPNKSHSCSVVCPWPAARTEALGAPQKRRLKKI